MPDFTQLHSDLNTLTGGAFGDTPPPKTETGFGQKILDAAWQLPVGFWEGFTTLQTDNTPLSKAGEVMRGVGQLLGFIGLIPDPTDLAAAPAKAALLFGTRAMKEKVAGQVVKSGVKALERTAAREGAFLGTKAMNAAAGASALEAKGLINTINALKSTDMVKAAELAAGAQGYGQLLGGILHGASIPLFATSRIMTTQKVMNVGKGAKELLGATRFFKDAERLGIATQAGRSAAHLALASSVSQLGINPKEWADRNDYLLNAAFSGGAYGGAFGAIGNVSRVFSKLMLDGRPTAAAQVLKAVAGAAVQGIPATARKADLTDQIYEYMLGGMFGLQSTPWASEYGKQKAYEATLQGDEVAKSFLAVKDYGRFAESTGITAVRDAVRANPKDHGSADNVMYRELLEYYDVPPEEIRRVLQSNDKWRRLTPEEQYDAALKAQRASNIEELQNIKAFHAEQQRLGDTRVITDRIGLTEQERQILQAEQRREAERANNARLRAERLAREAEKAAAEKRDAEAEALRQQAATAARQNLLDARAAREQALRTRWESDARVAERERQLIADETDAARQRVAFADNARQAVEQTRAGFDQEYVNSVESLSPWRESWKNINLTEKPKAPESPVSALANNRVFTNSWIETRGDRSLSSGMGNAFNRLAESIQEVAGVGFKKFTEANDLRLVSPQHKRIAVERFVTEEVLSRGEKSAVAKKALASFNETYGRSLGMKDFQSLLGRLPQGAMPESVPIDMKLQEIDRRNLAVAQSTTPFVGGQ